MEFITRQELEKQVLKRYDRNAIEIIDSAPLAAVYMFNKEQVKWEKLKCEGILFLYQKSYEPHFNLFLLNRINNSHLYQPINHNLKLQIEDSYLLFKNDNDTIFGLWIYDKVVYSRISDEIKKIIYNINLKRFCKIALENNKDDNISKLLRKTEEEYLKSFYCLKRLHIEKEQNECTSNSVAKFFEDACTILRNTKSTIKIPCFQEKSIDKLVYRNLIHNPDYNVESIEKNQRCSFELNNACSNNLSI
ncbi:hypothetical protein PGB90_007467 [Kerria lacca]